MKSIAVRELTGARLRRAAEDREILGVTSGRVLCAVLLPVQRSLLEQILERNLSEIVHGVGLGEQDVAAGDLGVDVDDLLDEPQEDAPIPRAVQRIIPVSIRGLSSTRIAEAAENKETLGVTNNGSLVALLIPVSQRWVDYIVQANLSRLVKGLHLGEAQAQVGDIYDVGETGAEDGAPDKESTRLADGESRDENLSLPDSAVPARERVAAW